MAVAPDPVTSSPELAAEMRPALVKYFRRKTGNGAEAEDLAQEVLVSVLRHSRWGTREQAKGYIFRSAVNRWRDYLRRRRTRAVLVPWDQASAQSLGIENTPERVLMAQQELAQIAEVLDSLPERTRTILMLIRFEQMKAASVAEHLGISVSAVNKHLASAVAALAGIRSGQELP